MYSGRVNIQIYFLFIIFLKLILIDISWYSFAAIGIFLYQFMLLFNTLGEAIPIRYISSVMMCIQMLLGPTLAYNGLDQFQTGTYKMQIPEVEYFSYAIPAVLCFIAGLQIFSKHLPGEIPSIKKITVFVEQNKMIPFVFIVIGFVASLLTRVSSSELKFVMVLLGSFKYVGLFLIILSNKKIKLLPLLIVYGSIILSSLAEGMFFDLITWLIFLGAVYSYVYKPSFAIKFSAVILLVLIAITIQLVKGDYREATWKKGEEGGAEIFQKTMKEKNENAGIFNLDNLAKSNVRMNQGYIVTHIMRTVPTMVPYENGAELKLILESAFLPRFLAPNKLNAGDRVIFTKYTNMPIASGTSMALSSMGDAYINFGLEGGCIFMFLFGALFNLVLTKFNDYSTYFPVLILFSCLVFYYPIRPDCELQTILGHLVKSCFLIFLMLKIWKQKFLFKESKI
jgi:hypothetical protein